MNEWVNYMRIKKNLHTKQRVHNASGSRAYITQLYNMRHFQQIRQQNIWSIHMASIGKENRGKQCFSYKEQ